MTIKIQCPCGAKYSFEVEPVRGRMPFAVHCPACNADGTEKANEHIAEAAAMDGSQSAPRPVAPSVNAALERLRRERRQFRAAGWIAAVAGALLAALLAAWGWFAFIGSKPRLEYSVRLPGIETGWRGQFLDTGVILLANADHATARDLKTARDLWTCVYGGNESDRNARPQTYIGKDSLWICLDKRLLRINRATGELKQTIPIAGQLQSFTPSEDSLLVVSARNDVTRLATRIDLASGEASTTEITVPQAQKQAMPNELPPNVQPTAGVLLAMALDEQKFNKPLDAMSSEFFSTGANLVELRVKLLKPRVTYLESIKPRGPTRVTGDLTASSSAGDVAEEVFNDIKRDQTGGVKGVDDSLYETTLRRWTGGAAPAEWKGNMTGVPMFFPLKTVDLLVAGRLLTVFDKENKKLFSAELAYPVNGRYSPGRWDRHSAPAAEGPGGLYFFDEGVLTAFSLPSGEVRWRLTSVGVSKAQFDDHGALYVDSTTASPDDIQYSDQIKMERTAPVLLKIDPASGKILWRAAGRGGECFLSGQFLYTASAQQGGIAMANGLAEAIGAPRPDTPVYFHIYRLDPADGKILWDFYREEAPAELCFQQNRFLIRFDSDAQVWKYIAFVKN